MMVVGIYRQRFLEIISLSLFTFNIFSRDVCRLIAKLYFEGLCLLGPRGPGLGQDPSKWGYDFDLLT